MRCYACGRDSVAKAYFKGHGKTTIRFICEVHVDELSGNDDVEIVEMNN